MTTRRINIVFWVTNEKCVKHESNCKTGFHPLHSPCLEPTAFFGGKMTYPFTLILGLILLSTNCIAAVSTSTKKTHSMRNLVLGVRPEVGFVQPNGINDLTTKMNTFLKGYGMSGTDIPMLSNTLQAEIYLGYAPHEDWDAGVFVSIPPLSSKTVVGLSATGSAVSRTAGVRAMLMGIKSHFSMLRFDRFRFYGSPAVGIGNFKVTDTLDAGALSYEADMEGRNLMLKGALGADYLIGSLLSLQLEGGYTYLRSGALVHQKSSKILGVHKGDLAQSSTQTGNLITDLSGFFVGVGLTMNFGI